MSLPNMRVDVKFLLQDYARGEYSGFQFCCENICSNGCAICQSPEMFK